MSELQRPTEIDLLQAEIERLRMKLAAAEGANMQHEAEIERLRAPLETLAERSGLELTICGLCGEPIIALMDGMTPLCVACAEDMN